jgi:hypothetical protein
MIINPYQFTYFDADAQAFFTASGLSDPGQKNAVNQLVVSLKSNNLWNKMYALYPFVGGTGSFHKWNLKNPLDTNGAFRIIWNGGVTHTSNGIVGNGTNGYGETYVQPSTNLILNSTHISFWSKTNSQNANAEMGISDGSLNATLRIVSRNASNQSVYSVNDNSGGVVTSVTDSTGFYCASRTASNSRKLYKNGTAIQTATTASVARSTATIPVLAQKNFNNIIGAYLAKTFSFASVGEGLNDTEALNFYNIVNTYNTALGR